MTDPKNVPEGHTAIGLDREVMNDMAEMFMKHIASPKDMDKMMSIYASVLFCLAGILITTNCTKEQAQELIREMFSAGWDTQYTDITSMAEAVKADDLPPEVQAEIERMLAGKRTH